MTDKFMVSIGTVLYNKKRKKMGMVIGYSWEKSYYDVDSDDEWFWAPQEVEIVPEKEALFYKLKYA
jgi:helix-turn-helix protein